jgi:hypothetical protein
VRLLAHRQHFFIEDHQIFAILSIILDQSVKSDYVSIFIYKKNRGARCRGLNEIRGVPSVAVRPKLFL